MSRTFSLACDRCKAAMVPWPAKRVRDAGIAVERFHLGFEGKKAEFMRRNELCHTCAVALADFLGGADATD